MITIDRFEGEYAVCETSEGMQNIHITLLPDGAKEGDRLEKTEAGYVVINIDDEREARRKRFESLFKKS